MHMFCDIFLMVFLCISFRINIYIYLNKYIYIYLMWYVKLFAYMYKIELQLIALNGSTFKNLTYEIYVYMFENTRASNCVNLLYLIFKKRTIRKIICINVLF